MYNNDFFGQFEKSLNTFIEARVNAQIAAHTRRMDDLVDELKSNKYTILGMTKRLADLENENFALRQRLVVIEKQLGITPPKEN